MTQRCAVILLVCLLVAGPIEARPTLLGPGGLITMPTAYLSTGGTVAPRQRDDGKSDVVSSLNYAWDKTAELAMLKPTYGETSFSLKYQLTQDVQTSKDDSPATALGFLDLADEHSKAFYGVMSRKTDGADLVLHAGVISERAILGNLRFMGGFETPLSKQMLFVGEYDGLHHDVNSGFVYHVSQSLGSFVYMMDVADSGLQAELVSGFTFKLAF